MNLFKRLARRFKSKKEVYIPLRLNQPLVRRGSSDIVIVGSNTSETMVLAVGDKVFGQLSEESVPSLLKVEVAAYGWYLIDEKTSCIYEIGDLVWIEE